MKRICFLTAMVLLLLFNPAGAADEFKALFSGQQTVDGENAVAVIFSKAVDGSQPLDTYLNIFKETDIPVEGAWVLSQTDPAVAYFTNVEPGRQYRVKVYKGLKAKDGSLLESQTVYEVETRQARPMISFGSKGFVLAPALNRGLPVVSLNIPKADIDFFRVRPQMSGKFFEHFHHSDRIYHYQSRDLQHTADLVYSGRWDLDIKKDLRTNLNIPITHIDELKPAGIYFAVLRGAGVYQYDYSATWFTVSDLGIHARVYENSVQIQVQSLETARPAADVVIKGYDKAGKTLFETRTNADGIAANPCDLSALSLVTAAKGGHISLLPFDMPVLDLSEFRTATAAFRPVDLFVYGPRNIYRPGETVYLDALLRDKDGRMTTAVPVKGKVYRPDGRMVHEFTWKGTGLNYYTHTYPLPENTMTGNWEVRFSQADYALKPYKFLVADFLPERMKFDISNPDGQTDVLERSEQLAIALQGDYLYGAPAAGNKADARIHLKPFRELFKDQWPGYEFGDIKDLLNTSYGTDKAALDENGKGLLRVKQKWAHITSPQRVTANVSLYDSGGRPVVRNKSWQVWPAPSLVGIRTPSPSHEVDSDSLVEFEVMVADKTGARLAAKGLKATVIREHREYYWEFRNGRWRWGSFSNFYPVDQFDLDIPENGTATVSVPVKWGGYRLEIKNPATTLVSAAEIWAGWRPRGSDGGELNRPDRVDLTLDKAAFKPGDVARVTVKAPEGGSGYLFVEADTNLFTLPITVPPEGKVFEVPIRAAWQRHDIYLTAVVVRPGESRAGHIPKRSVGLIHLPLDRKDRKLLVEIQMPDKMEPGRGVRVPVKVTASDGSPLKDTRVTLAAVDVGILNLTRFETPSPFDYFFQPRRYGSEMLDIYHKLIEANDGAWAGQRFGGDAPTLSRGGDRPATDVQIISIHRKAIPVDKTGTAFFDLDFPEFNGQVRLMAVAHTTDDFGSAEHALTLASPVVTQMTMPRFLAMGDDSQVVLDIHNLTQLDQALDLGLDAKGPVRLTGQPGLQLNLAPNEKRAIVIPVKAGMDLKRSHIRCVIRGIRADGKTAPRDLERTWFLDTRPSYPPFSRMHHQKLTPGLQFELPAGTNDLIPETAALRVSLGSAPPIHVSEHVRQLAAYPYGCLEQTVSGLFPFAILGTDELAALGLPHETHGKTAGKIRLGIQRLMEKQKSSGGFSLWSGTGPENAWLTAYTVHFLINAGQAGYAVPETAMKNALKRLITYIRRPNSIPVAAYYRAGQYKAQVRAYAAFVLGLKQSLTLGDARSTQKAVSGKLQTALSRVHIGAALYLAGDEPGAVKAFQTALETKRPANQYLGDYGSDLRDYAAAYSVLAAHCPFYTAKTRFLERLEPLLETREWLSTQERNALVMAGAVRMRTPQAPWQAKLVLNGSTQSLGADRQAETALFGRKAAGPFTVTNTGGSDVYVNLTLSGYTRTSPAPLAHGVKIKRRFLTLSGTPLPQGPLSSGQRLLVELLVQSVKNMPHCLVVDLLPAGLEPEDPNLADSVDIRDLMVDNKPVKTWHKGYRTRHKEYRDDRFVAALDIRGQRWHRLYYAVRVVTPGKFQVPPPLAEDMYAPRIRSIGNTPPVMEIINP